MKTLLILSLLAVSLTAHALPRTGGAYTLSPETTNAGGSRTTSASYSHEGSLGEIGGFASVASPSVTVLSGYIGAQAVVGLVPGVITAPVTNLTATGATLSGQVTSEGGSAATARGFVVGTAPNPTVENDTIVPAGSGTGSFTIAVTDLSPGTTYHLRAYATSEIGTGYGANLVFTTDTNVTFVDGLAPFARDILPGGRQVFHFSVGGPRIVSFAATGASLRTELFDDEGNLIASFNGDSDFDLEQLLLAGDYAFHVFRQDDAGTSQSFALEIDASVVAASRPDLAVGAAPAGLLGVGLYAPANQLVALVSKKAKAVSGHASLSNRGNLPDVLVGSATGGSRLFAVSYFDPAGNITAGLLTGTYTTPEMDENAAPVMIRATITPNKKKLTKKKKGKKTRILKKTHLLSLRLSSTFDPAISDAATIRVQTK